MPRKPKLDFICIDCKRDLPPTAFGINRAMVNGYDHCCRTCRAARTKISRGSRRIIPAFTLSDFDLGYVTAFIDGEGSIRMRWSDTGGYSLEVSATSTDRAVLDWLRHTLGGHVVQHSKATDKHRESFRWIASSLRARGILAIVGPKLKIKAKHATLVASFYEARGAYRESHPGGLKRGSLQEPLLSIVEALETVNRRGVHS